MKSRLHFLLALILVLTVSGGVYGYTFTTASGTIGVVEPTGDVVTCNVTETQPDWGTVLDDLFSEEKTRGEVPTGNLFTISPDATFGGDLIAKVYLANTGNLSKAYQYLNAKLYLTGSVESGETPNYRMLTLQNGEASLTIEDLEPVSGSWIQTSQADFEGGTPNQVDTITSPGDVLLDSSSYNVTDTYNDETKIASSANVTVSGGQVSLIVGGTPGTETFRPNAAGDNTSISTQFPLSGAHWDKVDEVTADNLTTTVLTNSTTYQQDLYNIPDHGSSNESVDNVTAYFRFGKPGIALDDNDFAVVYEGTGLDGFISTVDIDTSGQIAAALTDTLEYDLTNGEEPDILRIAGNIYAIAYDGAGSDGYVATVELANNGQITDTLVDILEFETSLGIQPDMVHVSGDVYAIAYNGPGGDGYVTTVEIDSTGQITDTIIDSFEFETADCDTPSIVHVNGNYYAIAFNGPAGDGFLVTVEITTGGLITKTVVDSFEFDISTTLRPHVFSLASDVVAIVYEGPASVGYLITIEIDGSGLINNTLIDSLAYNATEGCEPDVDNLSGDYYAIAYRGPDGDGWITTVEVNSAGSITDTAVDNFEFETVDAFEPSITNVSGDYYVVAYRGVDDDGWMATVEIDSVGVITASVVDTFEFDTAVAYTPRVIFVPDVSGTAYARAAIKTNGTVYTGTEESATDTSFTLRSFTWTTNPFTSLPWTWEEINDLQVGAELKTSDVTEFSNLTQVYIEVNYTPYLTSGTLNSINLLVSETVASIDSFDYNASAIPSGTSLKVQFSQNGSNWYNSAGTLNGWDILSQGSSSIDLSGLGWSGANFYYHMLFTSDTTDTPVLDETRVNYTLYYTSGDLISSSHDNGYDLDWDWGTISFTVTEPASTDVKFRLRTASTEGGLSSATWYGPTGTSDYYQTGGADVNGVHDGDRWMQYKAYFTGPGDDTPTFSDITITYNAQSVAFVIEITGGGYALVSDNTSEWGAGWTTTPEFYCEVTPR